MQSVTLERIMAIANSFSDSYDGVEIDYDIDDDYPRDEGDNEPTFSVNFMKNDTHLCRLFDDHELWMDDNLIILEDDYNTVRRVIPQLTIDVSNLIKSKKSVEEVKEFIKFLKLQLIHFGADDETNE